MKLFCCSLILVLSLGSLVSADLVAYWPFDSDPNNVQGNPDFDGVVIGDRVSFSGENVAVGTGALKIDDDGSGTNFVRIEPSPFVGVETKFSIVGWFLQKDISGDGGDSRQFVCETDDWDVSVGGRSDGEVGEWYIHGSPGGSDVSGPFITDDPNAWRHFALVYNAEVGYGRFYYDGQLRDEFTGTPGVGLNPTQYLNIGNHRDGNGGRNFDGYIDDMAVFDRPLTDVQVLALYDKTHTPDTVEQLTDLKALNPSPADGEGHVNGGILLKWRAPEDLASPAYNVYLSTDPAMAIDVITLDTDHVGASIALPSDLPDATTYYWSVDTVDGDQGDIWSFTTIEGLVAHWTFDIDDDMANIQGNTDLDGIAIGNAVVSADDVKVGTGALKIDDDTLGTNYVDIEAPVIGARGVFSIVCWYKYSDISLNGSDARNFIFETAPAHAASFAIRNDGELVNKRAQYHVLAVGDEYNSDAATGPVVDDGNWHHVALVWNNLIDNTIKYYHDGSLVGTEPVDEDIALAFTDGLHIGNHRDGDGGRNWDGYIDDMAIYDVELLPSQVAALYNGTRTPEDVLEEAQLTATNPVPSIGGKVKIDGQLSWQAPPDIIAPLFNIYISQDPNVLEDVIVVAQDWAETSVDIPDGLEYEAQYYWRVDSTNGTIYEGDIWSFMTPREIIGLVAWWPFDTDPNNAQGNPDFDGVVIGTDTTFSGENVAVGTGALKIDDDTYSTNFVQIENSPFVGIELTFSLSGWFLQTDISGDGMDSRLFVCETEGYEVSVGGRDTGEVGEWYMRGSPGWSDTSGPMITDDPNAWHHFTLVYNAEVGYGRFYFDGQLRDERTGEPGTGLYATEYLNIGNHRDGNGARNFDGYIDDMAVYDKALTDEQVLALYNKTHTPKTVIDITDLHATRPVPADGDAHVNGGGLLSWMAPGEVENPVYNVYLSADPAMANDVITLATDLDGTSIVLPSVLPDASNYYWRVDTVGGEQGETWSFTTIEGFVAHWTFDLDDDLANVQGNTDFDGIAIGNAVVSADDVKVGTGALKIDDATDSPNFVDIESAPILGAQGVYSIVGWYKYSDISSDGSDARNTIFETAPNYGASFAIRDSSEQKRAQYYVQVGGGSYSSPTASGPVVDDGNWHHVALVWDNLTDNSVKYYHDGSLFESDAIDAADALAFSDGFHIGEYRSGSGGRNFDGYIDDIAIYDKALSSYQVQQLVTNSAVNCGNVLEVRKYWADFDDNGVVDLDDLSNFAGKWLTDDPEVDYDGNGIVDFSDLGVFGESWQLVE